MRIIISGRRALIPGLAEPKAPCSKDLEVLQ
jgi:hypothetical protein